MEDDRPPPMKNNKPVQRNPNAADRFWQDHQAVYESQVEQSGEFHRVERHNDAFPKLKDELDRRRSVTQTKPVTAKLTNYSVSRTPAYNPNCKQCIKERKEQEARLNKKSSRKQRISKWSKVTKKFKKKGLGRGKIMKTRDCYNTSRRPRNITFEGKYHFANMASIHSHSSLNPAKRNNQNKYKKIETSGFGNNYFRKSDLIDTTKNINGDDAKNVNLIGSTKSVKSDGSVKSVNVNSSTKSVHLNSSYEENTVSNVSSGEYPNTSLFSGSSFYSSLTTDEPMVVDNKEDEKREEGVSVEQPKKE